MDVPSRRRTRFRDSMIALVLPRRRTSTRHLTVADIAEDEAGVPRVRPPPRPIPKPTAAL